MAKKETEEAKKAKEAEAKAKKGAEKAKTKKAKKGPTPAISSAAYEGKFQLVLPSSAGFKQVKQFTDHLAEIEDLKIVWTGGSVDEGTLIAVSVAKAMPLAGIISEMPMVEGVEVKGEKISVVLKVSA